MDPLAYSGRHAARQVSTPSSRSASFSFPSLSASTNGSQQQQTADPLAHSARHAVQLNRSEKAAPVFTAQQGSSLTMNPLTHSGRHAPSWRNRSVRDSTRTSRSASGSAATTTPTTPSTNSVTSASTPGTQTDLPPLPPTRDAPPQPETQSMTTKDASADDVPPSPTGGPPSPPSQSQRTSDGPQKQQQQQQQFQFQRPPTQQQNFPQNGFNSPRKIRSQYPANSTENHVEYILVASFDIDRGSVMEHQYPGPISGDEHMLAELMLPDQAHMRNQDWTVFFLHKDTSAEDEAREARRERRALRAEMRAQAAAGAEENGLGEEWDEEDEEDMTDTEDEDYDDGIDGPPLIYVLNLVNTKQDNTVKRGAVVKAMAICTRHSFLHIYKVSDLPG